MRPISLASLFTFAAASSLVAQDQFSRSAMDHVPARERSLLSPVIADFDGDGDLDVFSPEQLRTNFLGRFVDAGSYVTGGVIYGAYDFDGDGLPDLLDATSSGLDRMGIAMNRLPFSFQRQSLGLSSRAQLAAHAVADFDQDGDLDIVLAPSTRGQQVLQLENDGAGGFTDVSAIRMPPSGFRLETMDTIDFDGDGDQDLIAGDPSNSPVLGIMVNQGGGVFLPMDFSLVQSVGREILHVVDIDGDGDEDVFVDRGRLIENNNGVLVDAAIQVLPNEPSLTVIQTGDLDGDGDLDVYADFSFGSFRSGWYENSGASTPFVDRRLAGSVVRRNATAVEITDVDRDGILDVLSVGDRIQVLLGQPSGEFLDLTPELPGAQAYGDFNGDGWTDSLFSIRFFELFIRKGNGVGGFTEERAVTTFAPVRILNQADVDLDGDLDFVFWGPWPSNRASIGLNDGTGRFTNLAGSIPGNVDSVAWSHFADLDGDGDEDLVLRHTRAPNSRTEVLFNDGQGGFTVDPARQFPALLGEQNVAAIMDADADGDVDLVIGSDDPVLYRNDGSGVFAAEPMAIPARFPTVGDRPSTLMVADVDGDGDSDLIATHGSFGNPTGVTNDAVIYENDSTGMFATGTVFDETAQWFSAKVIDVDVDGDVDLVVGTSEVIAGRRFQTVDILENDGAGTFARGTKTMGGMEFLPTLAADVDDDGDIDLSPYVNNTTQLRARFQPRLGGSIELNIPNTELLRTQTAFLVVSAARFAQPVQLPGMLGQLAVDPSLGATLVEGSAFRGVPLFVNIPVPNTATLGGVRLYAQALLTRGPRMTNAVEFVLAF